MIPFNKPFLSGKELDYIKDAVSLGKLSGNGQYTRKCHGFFQERYGFKKVLLTSSCTAALEMAAMLLNIEPGDEVIMPSYTFVSTANAFVLRGATIVFADSQPNHPGIDENKIEELITSKTKAIVPVHYGGVACDMDKIMAIAARHDLFVVEDAAQAIDGYYSGKDGIQRPLGGIGHLAAFSFHETKNIQCGEGGMLVINDERFMDRAEIIWEKGTNRTRFMRKEIDHYNWVDIGSSLLPSEITAAFLLAQLENLDDIQKKRKAIWQGYWRGLKDWAEANSIRVPAIPRYAGNNGHLFYLLCKNLAQRTELIGQLKEKHIQVVFHYLSLHKSPFYRGKHDGRMLPQSDRYSDCLLRLPFYFELTGKETEFIVQTLKTSKDQY
ncbi:MAG: dTDP-4-amino-4,6-dideoxygalactose transaminase [Candidatus Aminicenantes bacterium]|nr:dTDP-4-amino-4,6-dideoxygalactose transaminase [Candidatus Aminicenantes bacterium]